MDKGEIEKIREHLLASNPELSGRLTDETLGAAIEKANHPNVQARQATPVTETIKHSDVGREAADDIKIQPAFAEVAGIDSVAKEKAVLEAVLNSLNNSMKGEPEAFTTKDDELAERVEQILGM